MKQTIFFLLAFVTCACQKESAAPTPTPEPPRVAPTDFVRSVDISFLPEIEAFQPPYTYLDRTGQPKDLLSILKENGVNTIRVRLWHTPSTPHSGLDEVKIFSSRIKAAGLQLWLDIHYSDTWADPGQQSKPAAWSNLSSQVLSDSVYAYTKKVVALLQPDIIQIGNEINAGFLWPEGSNTNPNFFVLLKSALKAVQDLPSPKGKTLIHYAGLYNTTAFFQALTSNNVQYDLIGLSYYPFWHGKDMGLLKNSLASLSLAIGKKIIIAETAYPFSLLWNDMTNNLIGTEDQLVTSYPATTEGQKKLLLDMKNIVIQADQGFGICYWAPEWVAFKGSQSATGSSWENMALFDFDHKAVPAIEVFKKE